MKRKQCSNCILDDSIPNVEILSNGLCNFCNDYELNKVVKARMNRIFASRMEKIFQNPGENMYDVAVMFSGGKDSAMLLKMAKEKYHLRTLAVSVMHPLINKIAKQNIDDVAKKLQVDVVKIQIQEDVFKKVIRQALVHGKEYDLNEFVGCDVCNFLFMWVALKMSMRLRIPTILEGSDKSQNGAYFIEGKKVDQKISKGIMPYGRLHDIVRDALGEEMKGSIYGCEIEDLKKYKYPNVIAPFMFTDYSFKDNFNHISQMGLDSNKFRSIVTNCDAVPFFSYIALKRFGCISYVKHFANEIRNKYPNISQLSLDDKIQSTILEKEKLKSVLNEYEDILNYVVDNNLNDQNVDEAQMESIMNRMGSEFTEYYGLQVSKILVDQILQIHKYCKYFDIDLDEIQ